jgi:uncharacterized protein YjdB
VTAVAVGSVTIAATSEGKQGVTTITVNPIPVSKVTVTPTTALINIGGTQQFVAATTSATGATLTGRTIVWTSSDPTKATVNSTGLVTAVAQGTVTIAATSEGISGTATFSVASPAPVATITISPATSTLAVGTTATLIAAPRDAAGNPLIGRVFTWASSNLSVVSGTFVGNVLTATAVSAGTATITATSEGRNGSATITVSVPPSITSVSPSTLVPGTVMTITGAAFSPLPSGNTVRVGSVAAPVITASSNQLTATVPCIESGTAPVTVTTSGLTSQSASATIAVATQTLAVGQSAQMLSEASVRCNELSVTGGKYLISVFNASTVPSSNGAVSFFGNTPNGSPGGTQLAPSVQPLQIARPSRSRFAIDAVTEQTRRATAMWHARRLEQDRMLYAQAQQSGVLSAARTAAPGRAQSQAVAIPLTVGAIVPMKNRGLNGSCATTTTSSARVVAVNAHSILLEDNASPTAGQVDADLIALGQIFETSEYAVEANFGDINAYDVVGGLDNPGRVVMFFTPSENVAAPGGGIVLGHVSLCDLLPPSIAAFAGSNNTKIFYARIPTILTGSVTKQDTRAWWNAVMPGTLVHEAKHLTSYAEHSFRNATVFEESWLEEGTAQIATEFYSRSVYAGSGWKSNTTYANSVACDARRGTPACPNGQYLMQDHFDWLYSYEKNNESLSVLSPGSVDGTIYGSAWMFARWLVDQYGGAAEPTLLRAITQETAVSGVNNVIKQTGQSFTSLLADWTMMLIADDYPGFTPSPGAKYTFPGWNTRSIWAGYTTDFGLAFPLNVIAVNFGSFGLTGALPGAAAGLIELSGTQTTKQLLNLSGLPLGTTIRMSILRVQ